MKIMRFSSLCQFVLGVAVAFSGNYYVFLVLRFLLAMVSYRKHYVLFIYFFACRQNPSLSGSTGFCWIFFVYN